MCRYAELMHDIGDQNEHIVVAVILRLRTHAAEPARQLRDALGQHGDVHGLEQIVVRAGTHHFLFQIRIVDGGEDHRHRFAHSALANPLQYTERVGAGKKAVHHQHVRLELFHKIERFHAVLRGNGHLKSRAAQRGCAVAGEFRAVVRQNNFELFMHLDSSCLYDATQYYHSW